MHGERDFSLQPILLTSNLSQESLELEVISSVTRYSTHWYNVLNRALTRSRWHPVGSWNYELDPAWTSVRQYNDLAKRVSQSPCAHPGRIGHLAVLSKSGRTWLDGRWPNSRKVCGEDDYFPDWRLFREIPYSQSFILDLSEQVDSRMRHIIDYIFLPGFNNPTVAVLCQPQQTWTGYA